MSRRWSFGVCQLVVFALAALPSLGNEPPTLVKITSTSAVFPRCSVLVPENDSERMRVRQALESGGVGDRISFIKNGISGRLDSLRIRRGIPTMARLS
jgi:hypothetical protein